MSNSTDYLIIYLSNFYNITYDNQNRAKITDTSGKVKFDLIKGGEALEFLLSKIETPMVILEARTHHKCGPTIKNERALVKDYLFNDKLVNTKPSLNIVTDFPVLRKPKSQWKAVYIPNVVHRLSFWNLDQSVQCESLTDFNNSKSYLIEIHVATFKTKEP